MLKGKVWPRGEKEPSDWTIEAVDELGNLHGSPGLFGNANESEILIDNIKVTPNARRLATAPDVADARPRQIQIRFAN